MRDSNRIKEVLDAVLKVWTKYPDLRFCQLINNCVDKDRMYYVELDLFMRLLAAYYNIKKE